MIIRRYSIWKVLNIRPYLDVPEVLNVQMNEIKKNHVPEVLNVQMNELKKNRTIFVRNSFKK